MEELQEYISRMWHNLNTYDGDLKEVEKLREILLDNGLDADNLDDFLQRDARWGPWSEYDEEGSLLTDWG